MARLNEEEAWDNKLTLEGNENRRLTIIDQLDRAPKDELCSNNDVLQLATHCCQVYDHWVNHPEEFSLGHEMRTKRRQTLLSLTHAMPAGHEKDTPKPDDLKILDLREFSDWFLNHNSDISLRFNSVDALNKIINQRPDTWFAFLRYLSHSLHYADLHIEAQSSEIENLRSSNENLCSGPLSNTIDPDKKKRYRDEILRLRKNVGSLIKERDDLKSKLERSSIQEEADSDDEFLNRGADDVNNSRVISNPSSPLLGHQPPTVKPELENLFKGSTENINSSRPPDKMDVFDGVNRDKYDEWVDKLLGQFRTHEDWFANEDRKITYLMRHITSAPYHLLKGRYDERARLNPGHGRTAAGALAELDRAFRAHDTRRDAKTKLEALRMGNHESFGDFFAKFQIQINKLDYHNEDKIDELKARLNGRFASRIILGRKDTYEELINHCYTLDSELKMYEAKKREFFKHWIT